MSNYVETIFTRESDLPGRELHCQMDGSNRVSWQEVPVGEQGISRSFETSEQAVKFMNSNARVLGYLERKVINEGVGTSITEIPVEVQAELVVNDQDFRSKDLENMHRTGKVPGWARFYKADSF